MKKIASVLCLMAAMTCASARFGYADDVDGFIYRSSALAVSTAPVFDVGGLSRLSVQVTYSSATNATVSFTSGVKSTATITVGSNYALLADATGYATIKVSSNSAGALSGSVITINGYALTEGILWNRQDTSTGTAASLAEAIDRYTNLIASASYVGTSSDTVRSSATVYGSFINAYTITTSTPAALNVNGSTYTASSVFTGGRDRGWVSIAGTTLYAGKDFSVGTSTAATATNIAAAMNADATISAIVTSTAPLVCTIGSCGIVRSTANVTGVNAYALSTSSYPILTPSGSIYQWGTASDITSATDLITKSNTLGLGSQVVLGATAPTGLTANATYFIIPVQTGASFKLSDTSTGSVAGVVLDISTTAVGGGTFTLLPSTCTTGASFVFQTTNEPTLTNWITAVSTGSVATITIGPPSGVVSNYFDLGFFNAKYLRFNFTKPTRGAIVTDISIHGKR